MSTQLSRLIDAFVGLRVIVIGEAMLDTYLEGTSGRLCREAPVPIVSVTARRDAPGGASNTALNVHGLGAEVVFLSVIGDDPEGAALGTALEERGLATENLLIRSTRRTLAKQRIIAASQLLVRFDQGSTGPVDAETERLLIDRLVAHFPRCDAVAVSDYGYGILTPRVLDALRGLQARYPRVIVVDSKRLAAYRDLGVTAVKPNYEEAVRLVGAAGADRGEDDDRAEAAAEIGHRVLAETGARIAAVTLDTEGALVFERGRPPYRTFAQPMPHARAAGAGDTFVAGMTLALAAGAETSAAAEIASAAAAVVVAKEGTVACTAAELRARASADSKPILGMAPLVQRLDDARRQGRRIVFTNGCFDILHRGHITYLGRAKALGDLLVVGVNSDESIRRLKGPTRPINTLEDRVEVLAALSCVDHIVPFDDDTPCALIRSIRPDVFVKGGDYTRDRLPEARIVEELGGVVQILPLVAERSTTGIIDRIRGATIVPGEGASALPAGPIGAGLAAVGSTNGHRLAEGAGA